MVSSIFGMVTSHVKCVKSVGTVPLQVIVLFLTISLLEGEIWGLIDCASNNFNIIFNQKFFVRLTVIVPAFITRAGFLTGHPIPRKNPRDIPKMKNPESWGFRANLENTENCESRRLKSRIPGMKISSTKKNPISRFWDVRGFTKSGMINEEILIYILHHSLTTFLRVRRIWTKVQN